MDLDPSLAFTALLEMWPGYGQMAAADTERLTSELAKAMSESDPPDRWQFARRWIDAHAKADPTRRYKITWVFRGYSPDLVSDSRYTWAQVEHELSYDDGDRHTVWAADPSVRAEVPPAGPESVEFFAVRQARTKVVGSRVMTRAEANREVAVWSREIGPAAVLPVSPDLASAVEADDQEVLVPALYGRLGQEAPQCGVTMTHPDGPASPCVMPKNHQVTWEDSDHRDNHGHTAPVLVRQSTLREVAAVSAAGNEPDGTCRVCGA